MTTVGALIETNRIDIVSGEGEVGIREPYAGARTLRAVKARLTRERRGGDRWARALVFSHATGHGDVFVDIETGEYR